MASEETLRLLLQNKFDRIENLVKMNHAATLAVPSVLAAIWGISWEKNGSYMDPVLCIISIGLLLVWRYFAHYIDNDVTSYYSQILRFEKKLEIPKEFSIYPGVISRILESLNNKQLLENANELSLDQRIELIDQLYERKLMGYRGHDNWDFFAFFLIFLNTALFFSLFAEMNYFTIILLVMLCIFFVVHIRECCYIFMTVQRDPNYPEFYELIENAKKSCQ